MSSRRLLKNSGIYGMVQILQKCIGLVLIPVYTTLLTPAEKGITDVVTPIVSFLSILYSLSINSAVIRFYVDYKEDKNVDLLDIDVNICRKKHQSNVRASGSDESLRLSPPKIMSLEEALEFIEEDELIEITPNTFRIRKKVLETNKRYKSKKGK